MLGSCAPETDLENAKPAGAASSESSGQLSGPADQPAAGQIIEPAAGVAGVPTNLARLVVQFAEPVAVAVRAETVGADAPFVLQGGGDARPLALGPAVPCDTACYEITIPGALAPSTAYSVLLASAALSFLDGKPVPAANLGNFTTTDEPDTFAPRIVAFSAQIAEGCVAAHLVADEPVRVVLTAGAADRQLVLPRLGFARTLDHSARLDGLVGPGQASVVATAYDLAGNTALSAPVALDMPPALPPLVVTELMPNPAGSENTQEWVEIYNAGSQPVELGGLTLADKTGRDALPPATLAAGGFALVVPEKYDPAAVADVPPKDSAVLVRVSGRLGSDGLSNAGEPVRLLDAGGHVISQYGGWVDTSASAWSGKSVKRASYDACDSPDAWGKEPSLPTPGW